jgi:hypothetical protein
MEVGYGFDNVARGTGPVAGATTASVAAGVLVENPAYWLTKSPSGSRIFEDGEI